MTGMMDDLGQASSGDPHTITKGDVSSTGLNKVDMIKDKILENIPVHYVNIKEYMHKNS